MYRIMSLDGGGVRGVYTVTLLERIQQLPGLQDFIQRADLLAGTSAGGIIALGLAVGKSPAEMREFYEKKTAAILKPPKWLTTRLTRRLLVLQHFTSALYRHKQFRLALESVAGDARLRDLRHKVLITAYDLNNPQVGHWKAKFFHNFPDHELQTTDGNERVVDVALRSSAAPTFFPFYERYVDGGVAANNPAMCALAQALNLETGGQELDDIVILSIGAGEVSWRITQLNASWGVIKWMTNQPGLTDLLIEGNVDVAFYQARQILRDRLHRLNPILPHNVTLDDAANVPTLIQLARDAPLADITYKKRQPIDTATWMREYWV
jgi:patatin-like phospholipase/acyl hydrolase